MDRIEYPTSSLTAGVKDIFVTAFDACYLQLSVSYIISLLNTQNLLWHKKMCA